MDNYLRVGILSSTHGVKGEIKVFPTTDDVKRFSSLKKTMVEYRGNMTELEVEGAKYFKQFVILKFKGIDSLNEVEKYKGCNLLVSREDAIKLEPNENFICDLIGCKVVTDEGDELGNIVDVMLTGANDVYVVESFDKKEILIPVIKDCVLDVDIDNKQILVHLLKGLMDL